ncbi:hypothetical protein D9757_009861 [Collybiopsis confluens]|uniref:UDP-Glycosyltransferase/glycogen phosphorylase n=1 Tax=Collybiopsis confluens TaxID=2823264 RepID=A0A8H5M1P2_9AGAR|nr:hypothetical protein D9757_009861 [Collybiopsis confluens]
MPTNPTHLVVVCSPLFGHARPTFNFCMNLLNEHPSLYISYVCTGTSSSTFTPPFEREMILYNLKPEPRSRLNITLLGQGTLETTVDQIISLFTLLPTFLGPLLGNQDASTATDPFQRLPSALMIEAGSFAVIDILDAVIASTPNPSLKIPILAFFPTNAAVLNLYWIRKDEHPETYWPSIYKEAEQELAAGLHEGLTLGHVAFKVRVRPSGFFTTLFISNWVRLQIWCRPREILVKTPNLPPMYNYELNPQTEGMPTDPQSFTVAQADLGKAITDRVSRISGFFIHTSPLMEPEETADMARTSPIQAFLHVGPQFPPQWWDEGIPKQVSVLSDEDQRTLSFLDDMESRYGKQSVLYISFGTLYVPSERPQLFDALIKTILAAEPPLPFVFAGAKSGGILSDSAKKLIEECGRGLLADFVPQQALLKHDATGFYLCHAGSNSISEAFLNGVPMVLWPYSFDQPLIANQVSVGLGLAFELIQVRNGESAGKPTHRGPIVQGTQEAVESEMTDIWNRMRGEEGQKMRERVIDFSKAMRADYKNGKARQAMNRISELFFEN